MITKIYNEKWDNESIYDRSKVILEDFFQITSNTLKVDTNRITINSINRKLGRESGKYFYLINYSISGK